MTSQAPQDRYDAVVVGGGMAGLTGALYLGRSCRRVAVVDSGDARNMAAGVMHNHITNDGATIADFRARARADLAPYDVDLIDDVVDQVRPVEGGEEVEVVTAGHGVLRTRMVLYAAGVRSLVPDVPGFEELWGSRIFECPYCHAWEVRGGRLGVYGGAEPSECLASTLTQWADEVVYLPGDRDLSEEEAGHLEAAGITSVRDAVAKVVADGEGVRVELASGRSEGFAALFLHLPIEPRLDPLRPWVEADDLWSLQTDERGRTSVPRLYVAGDLGLNMQQGPMAAASGGLAAMAINADLIREDRPGSLYDPTPAS